MTLGALARRVGGRVVGDPSIVVHDVTHDSRAVVPGMLFVAVRGLSVDGHAFVDQARSAGASAVCVEEEVGSGPAIVVESTRLSLGPLASAIHGDPSTRMRVIGITGTNGKTTVTHMIEAIVEEAGIRSAVVGTLGARVAGSTVPLGFTTPEASDLQRVLRSMADEGVDVVAMEVSSHALALGRVEGTTFAVVGFTNLSQDHLDFHEDMEQYFDAKASLFTSARAEKAVVWSDDPAGRRIAASTDLPVLRVGVEAGEIHATDVSYHLDGTRFQISGPFGTVPVRLQLLGDFNVANALVAAGCAAEIGISWDTIAAGLGRARPVPGRFEVVETGRDCTIVVDYAHTPEGVRAAVAAARPLVPGGRVIVVVGAGGDRDRTKRPLMGRAAADADVAVLTSDNPRTEDPEAILDAVVAGAAGGGAIVVREVDRRAAIRAAVCEAQEGDLVLVLGKGHEQGQDFGDHVVPFDDRDVVREEAASC